MAVGETHSGNIKQRQQQYHIIDTGSNSIEYINASLKAAWGDLYATQKKSDILRKTYLEDLAHYKAQTHGTKEEQELTGIFQISSVPTWGRLMISSTWRAGHEHIWKNAREL